MQHVIPLKVTRLEREALRRLSGETGDSTSELLREALYARFGVGEWTAVNSVTGCSGITVR